MAASPVSPTTVAMVVDQKLTSGATYTGRLVNNKCDGRGTCTWPNGTTYYGEWHNGKRDGWGYKIERFSQFEGLWRHGRWKRGTLHHKKGVYVYSGEWVLNETNKKRKYYLQGWGVKRRSRRHSTEHDAETTTTVYEGEWDRGKYHGCGTLRSCDGSGDIYHGMFDHGKRSGKGRMLFGDNNQGGGSYVGEWKDDMFHGLGVRLWANGDRYDGQWVCGKENGEGTSTWARDGKSFDGVCEAGVIKSGTMRWPNGDQFSGTFRGDGVGEGTATFRSGSGGPTSGVFLQVEGTLKETGVFQGQENSSISHCMGGGNVQMEIKERKHKNKIQSLKQELQQVKQKLDKQTECFEHLLKHIQHGVWMKSIGQGETQDDVQVCVMNKVSVTLEGHNTTFPESVCSLCPLDKVVKMEVEKLFGVDENQQVVTFSTIDKSDEVALSLSLSAMPLSQLASHFPLEDVPEVKVRMMPVMAIKEEELKFVSPLGSGSYGSVGKFIHTPTGRQVAVKTLYDIIASDRNIERFRLEAEIVSGLRHPNILKCVGTSITTGTGKLQIVSELMCCSLRQLLKQKKQLSVNEVAAISLNVAKGMDSLHRQNFMHRDLSSNNVLFDSNGIPKICDFGESRAMDTQQGTARTIVPGTQVYMAPQMFTTHYSFEGDIWGFGILVSEMLNGDIVGSPFDRLPLQSQANFMTEQKRLLSHTEVEEVDKLCQEMLSQKSSDSAIASCLSRRNASLDAVIRAAHSPDSLIMLPATTAAADLIVLVVQSCLSILERNRMPFTVISKLLLCVCTTILSHHTTGGTAVDRVTDDRVNESIERWLNALAPAIHATSSPSSSSHL
ncbi:MAP kinase [Pelomyxa schiedti]|nr:MAP kinase [Pelomyxa schiedti]